MDIGRYRRDMSHLPPAHTRAETAVRQERAATHLGSGRGAARVGAVTQGNADAELGRTCNPSLGLHPGRHPCRSFAPPFVTLSHEGRGSPVSDIAHRNAMTRRPGRSPGLRAGTNRPRTRRLPMPVTRTQWHIAAPTLAYRCGGSAGLVRPCWADVPTSRLTRGFEH
jgi:hypothetical protein